MSKRAPSTAQLLVIAGFALSCFGILLFLWVTFGGPTPFKAKPYEIGIPFNEATQLAQQSDVRISGVNVGKVQSIGLAPDGRHSLATVDIADRYGPIPLGTRAILRTKTLLGETYIELTPGPARGPKLPDGATLPVARVAESVQLDEIFRTFDPATRAAFREWMRSAAVAIGGRGADLSAAFAELEPTLSEFDRLFRVLDSQRLAVRRVFSNGAVALRALRGRQGELAGLIRSGDAVFGTTAARDRDIEALFRVFPTFEDQSRLTLERLRRFALNTDPLMRQLVPAAEQLSPTLIAFSKLAPQAQGFFEALLPVIARSSTGFPALRRLFRDDFPVLLRALSPFARNLNPILTGLGLYKRELAAAMANVAAAANSRLPNNAAGVQIHYLRALGPFAPESLATFGQRLTTNRTSAYSQPLAAQRLAQGLLGFDTRQCSAGIVASLDPATPEDPAFSERVKGSAAQVKNFFERLKRYAFAGQESSSAIPAPACAAQPPFKPIYGSGSASAYQHVFEQGE
jgi:phospholipid/cholesterol/gamma-HCH transport system substrate-binding protein